MGLISRKLALSSGNGKMRRFFVLATRKSVAVPSKSRIFNNEVDRR